MQGLVDQNRKSVLTVASDGKEESSTGVDLNQRHAYMSASNSVHRRPASGGSAISLARSSGKSNAPTSMNTLTLSSSGGSQTEAVNFFNLRNTSSADSTQSSSTFSAQSRAAGLALLRKGEDVLASLRSEVVPSTSHAPYLHTAEAQGSTVTSGFSSSSVGMGNEGDVSANAKVTPQPSIRNPSPKLDSFPFVRHAEAIRKQREDLELLHQEKIRIALNAQDAKDEEELESILAEDKNLTDPQLHILPPLKFEPKTPTQTIHGVAIEPSTSVRPGSSGALRSKQPSPRVPLRSQTVIVPSKATPPSSSRNSLLASPQKSGQLSTSGRSLQQFHSQKTTGFDPLGKRTQLTLFSSIEKSPRLPPSRKGQTATSSTAIPHLSQSGAPKMSSSTSTSTTRRKSSLDSLGASSEFPTTLIPAKVEPTSDQDGQDSIALSQMEVQASAPRKLEQNHQLSTEQQTHDVTLPQNTAHIPQEVVGINSEPNSPVPSSGLSEVSLRAVLASASERHLASRLNIPNLPGSQAALFRNRPSYLGTHPSKFAQQQVQSAKKHEQGPTPPSELSPFETMQVSAPLTANSTDDSSNNGALVNKKFPDTQHTLSLSPTSPVTPADNAGQGGILTPENVNSDRLSEFSNAHDLGDYEYHQTSPVDSTQAHSPNLEFGFSNQQANFEDAEQGDYEYENTNEYEDIRSNGAVIHGDEFSIEDDTDFHRQREVDRTDRKSSRRQLNLKTRKATEEEPKLQPKKYDLVSASQSPKQRNTKVSMDHISSSDSIRQVSKEELASRRRSSSSNSALSTSNLRRGSGSSTGAQVYNLFMADNESDNETSEDFEDFFDVSQHDEDEHDYQGDSGGQFRRHRRKSRRVFGNDVGEGAWDGYDGDSDSMAVLSESLFDLLNDSEKERGHIRTRDKDTRMPPRGTHKSATVDKSPGETPFISPDQTPQLLPNLSRSVSLTLSGVSSAAATAAPSEAFGGGKSFRNVDNTSPAIQQGETKFGFESDRSVANVSLTPRNNDLMVLSDIGIETATSSRDTSTAPDPSPRSGILDKVTDLGLKLSLDLTGKNSNSPLLRSNLESMKSPKTPGSVKARKRPSSRAPSIGNLSRFEDSDSLAFDSDISPLTNSAFQKRKGANSYFRGGLARNRAFSTNTQAARQRFESEFVGNGIDDDGDDYDEEHGHGEGLSSAENRSPTGTHVASDFNRRSSPRKFLQRTSAVSPRSPKSPRGLQKLPRLSINQTVVSEMDIAERDAIRSHTSSLSSSLSPRSSGRSSFSAQSVQSAHFASSRSRSFSTTPSVFKSPFNSQKSIAKTPISRKNLSGKASRSLSVVTKRIALKLPESIKAARINKGEEENAPSDIDPTSSYESTLSPDVLDRALKAVAESIHALKVSKTQALNQASQTEDSSCDEANSSGTLEGQANDFDEDNFFIPPEAIPLIHEYEQLIDVAKRKISEQTHQYWLSPFENRSYVQGSEAQCVQKRLESHSVERAPEDLVQLASDFIDRAFQKRRTVRIESQGPDKIHDMNASDSFDNGHSDSDFEDANRQSDSNESGLEFADDKPTDATMRLALQFYAQNLVEKGTLPENPLPSFIASQLRKALGSSKKQITLPLVSRRFGKLSMMDRLILDRKNDELSNKSDDNELISKLEKIAENSKQTTPNISKFQKILLRHLSKEDQKHSTVTLQTRPQNTRILPSVASKAEASRTASRKAKIEERREQTTMRAKKAKCSTLLLSEATNSILRRRAAAAPVRINILQRDFPASNVTLSLKKSGNEASSFALVVAQDENRHRQAASSQKANLSTSISQFPLQMSQTSPAESTAFKSGAKEPSVVPAMKNTLGTYTHLTHNSSPVVMMALSSDPSFVQTGSGADCVSTKVKKLDGTLRRLNTSLRQKQLNERLVSEYEWTKSAETEIRRSSSTKKVSSNPKVASSQPPPKLFQLHQVLKGQGKGYSQINMLTQSSK